MWLALPFVGLEHRERGRLASGQEPRQAPRHVDLLVGVGHGLREFAWACDAFGACGACVVCMACVNRHLGLIKTKA